MALKLLQPSLRPLGQFDLEDDDQRTRILSDLQVIIQRRFNSSSIFTKHLMSKSFMYP